MNLSVLPASCRQQKFGSADETSAARCWGAHFCADSANHSFCSAKHGAHGWLNGEVTTHPVRQSVSRNNTEFAAVR
jgi:hypothetical protein